MQTSKIAVIFDGPRFEIHNLDRVRGGKTETLAAGIDNEGQTEIKWSVINEDLVYSLVEAAMNGEIW